MAWRSLGKAWDGTEQFLKSDADGKVHLRTDYGDTQAVIDRNAELRKIGHGNGKNRKLAASIPLSLVFKWRAEHGVDVFSSDPEQKKQARKLLNDHQFKLLRVWEGHI